MISPVHEFFTKKKGRQKRKALTNRIFENLWEMVNVQD